MISQAGWWTRTPSATPLQPIKWNAHFWITFTLHDRPGWSMDSNPIHHPSPANKMKCYFLDYVQLLMISCSCQWAWTPSTTCLQPKKWNAHILIMFTSDDWSGWSMDSNPICHPSPAKKNEMLIFVLCSTSDVAQTGQWTQTPSTTPLQPIKWNASFWIMFTTDDQPGWSMDSNPICHPSPAKKMKCPYFDYVQLLMTGRAGQWTRKKMKCSFLDYVHFWWSAWLIDELEPHLPPLSYKKNEMINFRLRSTSDVWPDWSMDSNPICHPSPPNKMKCSFLDYVQLLMISRAGRWTQTPSATPLHPIKWNAHFWILFNFWWSARLVNGLEPHLPPLSSQKKWNTHFCITINFWFRPDWSMDSNPIHHPSPTNKMKCLFLDYAQLGMIGWTGWWTQTPSATPLQSKNEMLIFGLCSTSDDQPGW